MGIMANQISIQLTKEQRERLDEISKKEHRSLAFLVRDAVDFYLKFQKGRKK